MKIFEIDGTKLTNWSSFHNEFKLTMNFPEHYGENMNAWIDCVDDLTEEITLLKIENGKILKERNPEFLEAILECGSFVNYRKIDIGETPNLIIAVN